VENLFQRPTFRQGKSAGGDANGSAHPAGTAHQDRHTRPQQGGDRLGRQPQHPLGVVSPIRERKSTPDQITREWGKLLAVGQFDYCGNAGREHGPRITQVTRVSYP